MQKDDLFKKRISLLLDFDGTLVDLAPDPMAITVDPALIEAIHKIVTEKRTPLAIVTGRQIKVLDGFLGLPNIAVSGNHGTEFRPPELGIIVRHVQPMSGVLRFKLKSFCAEFGCILEDKNETAVIRTPNDAVFHVTRNELQKLLSEHFQNYTLWPVGLSLEIHHRGFSKVTGIQDILGTQPFKGYPPVYIGDDVETYPGLDSLTAENICMIPVGSRQKNGFSSPGEVRDFLVKFSNHKTGDDNLLAALIAEFGLLYRGM